MHYFTCLYIHFLQFLILYNIYQHTYYMSASAPKVVHKKSSRNNVFIIYEDEPHKLYIKNTHLSTINLNDYSKFLIQCKEQSKLKDYTCYHYSYHTFINDCLIFAEGLTIGSPSHRSNRCILRSADTNLLFGYTDKQNMKISKIVKEKGVCNRNINPNVSESYAFVLSDIENRGETPYHIAYVLFKDGKSNITLEADASDEDSTRPVFDIYDTDPNSKHTFYDEMVRAYRNGSVPVKNYVAITLRDRNIPNKPKTVNQKPYSKE
jgi:hypothetical protein